VARSASPMYLANVLQLSAVLKIQCVFYFPGCKSVTASCMFKVCDAFFFSVHVAPTLGVILDASNSNRLLSGSARK